MTLAELYTTLKATGYPVAYSHFTETTTNPLPEPPFITYLVSYNPNFIADNKVYKKINAIQIELYTLKKDLAAEKILEDLLDENGLPYQPDEVYIDSEKLFQRLYEIRI